MKFESRKDIFFSSVILGISVFLTAIMVSHIVNGKIETEGFWPSILLFSVIALLLWLYFGTNYELSKKDGLIYRSGPFNGKINADRITEVIKGKTLWVGFRPATARKGLIIKYDKYNELYITPKTNEAFINTLLELNKAIKISE